MLSYHKVFFKDLAKNHGNSIKTIWLSNNLITAIEHFYWHLVSPNNK